MKGNLPNLGLSFYSSSWFFIYTQFIFIEERNLINTKKNICFLTHVFFPIKKFLFIFFFSFIFSLHSLFYLPFSILIIHNAIIHLIKSLPQMAHDSLHHTTHHSHPSNTSYPQIQTLSLTIGLNHPKILGCSLETYLPPPIPAKTPIQI